MYQQIVYCCLNLCVVHLVLILAYHKGPLIIYCFLIHISTMMQWDLSAWFLHYFILPSPKSSSLHLESVATYSFPLMTDKLAWFFLEFFLSVVKLKVGFPIWILQPGSIQLFFLFGVWVCIFSDLYSWPDWCFSIIGGTWGSTSSTRSHRRYLRRVGIYGGT